jgi:hypothetical protein
MLKLNVYGRGVRPGRRRRRGPRSEEDHRQFRPKNLSRRQQILPARHDVKYRYRYIGLSLLYLPLLIKFRVVPVVSVFESNGAGKRLPIG